jgi:hypothetical protein
LVLALTAVVAAVDWLAQRLVESRHLTALSPGPQSFDAALEDAVRRLQTVYPDARRRVVNHAGVEDGVDLDGTGALRVQVKRQARYVPVSTLDDVKDSSGIALVLTKCDRAMSCDLTMVAPPSAYTGHWWTCPSSCGLGVSV